MSAAPVLDVRLQLALAAPGRRFALDVAFTSPNARTALLGLSGSGKSTVLLAIAGLLQGARGHVRIGETTLFDSDARIDLPTRRRGIGIVFQDYALFPHLSVEENVAFGVRRMGARLLDMQSARIEALLRQFELTALRHAKPGQLSGGQRQRTALARALAAQPRLLLLDEPLSALDAPLRDRLRMELAAMLDRIDVPTLLVSHDPQDVAALAQTVVRIDAGRVPLR